MEQAQAQGLAVRYGSRVLWQGYTPFKRREDGFESHASYLGRARTLERIKIMI